MSDQQPKLSPYDWVHEVTDPKLFAGRKYELTIIEEEIARLAGGQPIAPMIAIVGERRVGKTSLLLRVGELCSKHHLLWAKISLTVSTSVDPWEFWRDLLHAIRSAAYQAGILDMQEGKRQLGFDTGVRDSRSDKYSAHLQFDDEYGRYVSHTGTQVLASHIIQEDLKKICDYVVATGYQGILIMLDEAHLLAESLSPSPPVALEIKQQIRRAAQEAGKCGVIFAGEPPLAQLFTKHSEPLFAQGRVIPLQNFPSIYDIAECALLPLRSEERPLMSPMTIDYLTRLSLGRPNLIRLICDSIYQRYMRHEQTDLDIAIETLEDVIDKVAAAYVEYDLKKQVDAIRRLSSVDLEVLYDITRYLGWSTQDIVDLDECFRGEAKSQLALVRRARSLEEKRKKFISIGLLANDADRYVLAGDEFLYLYLRFWYEIRKYGCLRRSLVLGKPPPTSFVEKTDKLAKAIGWDLGQNAEITISTFHRYGRGEGDIISTIRRRFSILDKIMKGELPPPEDVSSIIDECFRTCRLVGKQSQYHLLCLSIRNLENPRELLQLELYFDTDGKPLVIPMSSIARLKNQAEDAKILLEAFDDFVVTLPDLAGLLNAISAPALDEIISSLDMVESWRLASVLRLVSEYEANPDSKTEENDALEDKQDEWLKMYGAGNAEAAENCLCQKLLESSEGHEAARLYNDRGYIRYGLRKVDLGKRDLQRALDLHYEHLPIVLMNLCVADIDEGEYDSAIQRIDDALLLTPSREEIDAGWLRLRLLSGYFVMTKAEKFEQNPANVIEASYVNLAYVLARLNKVEQAIEALKEGLTLMPSSTALRHALARVHIFTKHADLADPIYKDLLQKPIKDEKLAKEIELYSQMIIRGKGPKVRKKK